MFTILLILLVSCAAGLLVFRRFAPTEKILSHTTTVTIVLLLFTFGISIGSDRSLLSNISSYGISAIVIAILSAIGSTVAALAFARLCKKGGTK